MAEAGQPIFVLGNSRTGTTSIHHWLCQRGIRSVHFFIEEAGLRQPLHRYRGENWPKLLQFIRQSGYRAFSDYPVRPFFRELRNEFPDAYFVLSHRRDLATWVGSMQRFFAGRNLDIEFLRAFHIVWNEEIRCLFAEAGGRLLQLCIDADAGLNADRLAAFLGLPGGDRLPHLNASTPVADVVPRIDGRS